MQRVWRVSLVWRMDACARISPFPRDLNDVSLISLVRPLARHLYSSPCTRSSQLYTTEVQAFIFSGETPLDIVEEYTLHSGRMTPLPDWILSGAWRRLSLRPEVARLKGRCVGVSTPPRCDLRSALSLSRATWLRLTGPIVGYYNGTDSVLALHSKFKALGINITGYWLQDWTGLRVRVALGPACDPGLALLYLTLAHAHAWR